ncbi:MAG TPA: hypothetical protein VF286_01430 [Acidiphilium sp.]
MALRTLFFGATTALALVLGSWFVISVPRVDLAAQSPAVASQTAAASTATSLIEYAHSALRG